MLGRYLPEVFANSANQNAEDNTHSTDLPIAKDSGPASRVNILAAIQTRRHKARQAKSPLYSRLSSLGVSHEDFVAAVERSRQSGASAIQELISYDVVTAEDYYRRLAQDMDIKFVTSINPATILTDMNADHMEHGGVLQLFGRGDGGLSLLYVAPDFGAESAINELLEQDPGQKQRIRICTPRTILLALEDRKSLSSLQWATTNLYQKHPDLSAKQVLAPWQAYFLGLFCVLLPMFLYLQFLWSLLVIHLFSSLMFCVVIFIRLAALRSLKKRKPHDAMPTVRSYPKYSAMVALHKEAAVAGQLIRAMSRIDWPPSRLEVLYVCEADDNETIEALVAHGFPTHHRIIKVPASLPRTKPKALNFALKACKGDYVVIYDAEDRPHPQQLKEAWARFSQEDESLACLQAPLVVTNAGSSWFARMFAFEYAAHFKGLLPYLAQSGVPLPLGGTSNHFRKSALDKVGGWDPHNVTEDADLGIRFYRFGYRCNVLHLPTLEDGPETLKEWYPQRTRWQKGWMQTFLVHNRNVSHLFHMLGSRNTYYFEALLAGFILSPLLYIISILMVAYSIYALEPGHLAVTAIDLSLYAMGYLCSVALGFECLRQQRFRDKLIIGSTLPLYWLFLSAAAWRAVFQLVIKPHYWEKTPHRPTATNQVPHDHLGPKATDLQVSHLAR